MQTAATVVSLLGVFLIWFGVKEVARARENAEPLAFDSSILDTKRPSKSWVRVARCSIDPAEAVTITTGRRPKTHHRITPVHRAGAAPGAPADMLLVSSTLAKDGHVKGEQVLEGMALDGWSLLRPSEIISKARWEGVNVVDDPLIVEERSGPSLLFAAVLFVIGGGFVAGPWAFLAVIARLSKPATPRAASSPVLASVRLVAPPSPAVA